MNLQICGLSKSFGKNKALQKISIDFDAKVYGLLGENGSGKTTFLRCLARIYMTDAESVLWDQAPLTETREKDYLKNVGYLPQHFGLYKSLSLFDALSTVYFAKGLAADKREASILEAARLVNLTDKLQTRISALSGGMLRRAGIAQALLGEPSLLMFDEPTTGLDPEELKPFVTASWSCTRVGYLAISPRKNCAAKRRERSIRLILKKNRYLFRPFGL